MYRVKMASDGHTRATETSAVVDRFDRAAGYLIVARMLFGFGDVERARFWRRYAKATIANGRGVELCPAPGCKGSHPHKKA